MNRGFGAWGIFETPHRHLIDTSWESISCKRVRLWLILRAQVLGYDVRDYIHECLLLSRHQELLSMISSIEQSRINWNFCAFFARFPQKFTTFAKNTAHNERRLLNYSYLCTVKNVRIMSYTREPIIINNPSEKLLKVIEKLREHKRAELEKLRNMKPEEFSRRVILA